MTETGESFDRKRGARKILIVDDESLARQRLRRYLFEYDSECSMKEATSGLEAVQMIQTFRPDVVFLDVEMPGLNGFEVLAQFGERPFQIVFQTAFDEFAVRAFEEHAADYLLKPFTRERFQKAYDRVRERAADEVRLRALEAEFDRRGGSLKRLTVRQGGQLRVVEVDEICCFVSRDHYTCAYFADQREAICDLSLAQLLTRLDATQFKQLHRSNIVSIATIKSLRLTRADGMSVELENGMKLPVSRSNRKAVRDVVREIGGVR